VIQLGQIQEMLVFQVVVVRNDGKFIEIGLIPYLSSIFNNLGYIMENKK